jgi:hypothetical protein
MADEIVPPCAVACRIQVQAVTAVIFRIQVAAVGTQSLLQIHKIQAADIRQLCQLVIDAADALDGKIAYYISSEGEIVSLLPEMESDRIASTVSVYGDYVFISFIRMRYVADVLPMAYKNDTLSGTYRIDMQDLSVTKITDQHFYSMFIFDDTGIFGNNSSGMYKIDFDGNVILTIVRGQGDGSPASSEESEETGK